MRTMINGITKEENVNSDIHPEDEIDGKTTYPPKKKKKTLTSV